MNHHPRFPKEEGIPGVHLREVCLLHQSGACLELDFGEVRICAKGRERRVPQGLSNTGDQHKGCSGPPEYRRLLPVVPESAG